MTAVAAGTGTGTFAPGTTAPPSGGKPVALYDGHCVFCTSSARSLEKSARGAIAIADFQQAGVLDAFPGVTFEACMKALHLVDLRGRVHVGAAAVVQALRLGRPFLGRLAMAYYVPGLRQVADLGYRLIAKYRYKLFGKRGKHVCDGDSCSVHFR